MAKMHSTPPALVINIPDAEEEDLDFLRELDAAEAQALKRRRTTTPPRNEVPEGAYMAALRGSKSLTWQSQKQNNATHVSIGGGGVGGGGGEYAPRAVVGSGACYKCGKEGHWARECDVSSSGAGEGEREGKECKCGAGSCLVLTANTERNRGRKFFRCPVRQENGGCGFFEWCDESSGKSTSIEERVWKSGGQQQPYQHPAIQGSSSFTAWNDEDNGTTFVKSTYGAVQKSETPDTKGYGTRAGSSCFKCGGEGHWARDCSMSSSTVSAAGVGVKSPSNTCYKCGQSGHWARDCSQSQPTKPRNW